MPVKGTNVTPRGAYRDAKQAIREMQADLQRVVAKMAVEDVNAQYIDRGLQRLRSWRVTINTAVITDGIDDYVQSPSEENDPAYSFTTEGAALVALIDAAVTTVVNGMPTDGDGYTLRHQYDSNGRSIWRVLPSSSPFVTDFISDLNAIIGSIQ